jgi:hypothetical protein
VQLQHIYNTLHTQYYTTVHYYILYYTYHTIITTNLPINIVHSRDISRYFGIIFAVLQNLYSWYCTIYRGTPNDARKIPLHQCSHHTRSLLATSITNHHSEQSGHSTRRKTSVIHHFTMISPPQTSQTRRYVTYEDKGNLLLGTMFGGVQIHSRPQPHMKTASCSHS